MSFKTEQEEFWAGDFGFDYINRNKSDQLFHSKVALWANMLRSANSVTSIRELGCNIGLNLLALKRLHPDSVLSGIEINEEAAKKAEELDVAEITRGTIIEPIDDTKVDMTFTSGVLIHINPEYLDAVYANLVNGSNRYILISEYYSPSPTKISYRGHEDRLFKRDFAGELIDRYGLKLVDYGFVYKRDNWAPQDDVTWFLMEK